MSKTLDKPIEVEDTRVEEDEELSRDQASKFRSIAASANYLALDRPDLQVDVSVLCQPTAGSWELAAAETGREELQEVRGVVVRVLGRL